MKKAKLIQLFIAVLMVLLIMDFDASRVSAPGQVVHAGYDIEDQQQTPVGAPEYIEDGR